MNSTIKGDKLEDSFHQYLLDQQVHGELVFGAYPPENCRIYKKKKYYCREREADVEFDVVIELYRTGRDQPHLYVMFECKNHDASVSEIYVNDFSAKIGRLFPHATKGVFVVSSRLQSGAERVAKNGGIGIVKYDANGLEIVADRKGSYFEQGYVQSQIFRGDVSNKSLKFSAFNDGRYFSTIDEFLLALDAHPQGNDLRVPNRASVPFLTPLQMKGAAADVLQRTGYVAGAVNLPDICRGLEIDLQIADRTIFDADGKEILGSANFGRRTIEINAHSLETRERFTIAHEIGHFVLNHRKYLGSETIVEHDLFITKEKPNSFNYERLEYQANTFSAELLMPDDVFLHRTALIRRDLGFRDIGNGYIFVDDQPCNYVPFEDLLSRLSNYFEVSKRAIEVKLKKAKLVTDIRKWNDQSETSSLSFDISLVRKNKP